MARHNDPRRKQSKGKPERKRADAEAGLMQPSDAARQRLESIPLLFTAPQKRRTIQGRIVYDSWAHGPTMALRDATDGHIRRLRLKAGDTTVEILAERGRTDWSFVARVYRRRKVVHDFVLKLGVQKLLAGPGGFYQWTSSRVPRKLALISYDTKLSFDEVRWS